MKIKLIKLTAMILLPAALLALASCSSTPGSQTDTMHADVTLDTVTVVSTVDSIDASNRTVMLRHTDGSVTPYECGPEVRNFDQIKVGDQVTATVAESLALGLMKGGGLPIAAGTATAVVRAPLGAKPGAKIVDTVGFTAKVVSVDTQTREVTLHLVSGNNETVKVGPDINLANVSPGDDVGVRLTRAFAVAVTEPEK